LLGWPRHQIIHHYHCHHHHHHYYHHHLGQLEIGNGDN
jgi:hypothetical protein